MAWHRIPDLRGVRLGKLLGVDIAGRRGGFIFWLFECDCGDFALLKGSVVVAGKLRHCGKCKPPQSVQHEYDPVRWLVRDNKDDEFVPDEESRPDTSRGLCRNLKQEFAERRKEAIAKLAPGDQVWVRMSTGTIRASLIELRETKVHVAFTKTRRWVQKTKIMLDDKIFTGEVAK